MRKLILSVIVILAVITAICPSWAVSSTKRELVKVRRELIQMKSMPFGGFPNQMKAARNLESMGFPTKGQLMRSQQNSQGDKGMSTLGIVFLSIAGGLAVIGVVLGIIALVRGIRRFLADPNHEPAKSAKSPENVGEREIVSATARGDYHRETVTATEVGVARALAYRDNMDGIYALFASRKPEVVIHNNSITAASVPENKAEAKPADDETKKLLADIKKIAEDAKKTADDAKKAAAKKD